MNPSRSCVVPVAAAVAALMLLSAAVAGPLDSIATDPAAVVMHPEQTVVVPPNGAVGSDMVVNGRAFVSIDFAIEPNKLLSLVMVTAAQKEQMNSGVAMSGTPLVRLVVDGVASQSVTVDGGNYYVALLNDTPQPVTVTYRTSARAF
jgi:hypothetical protein